MQSQYEDYRTLEKMRGQIKRAEEIKKDPSLWARIQDTQRFDKHYKDVKARYEKGRPPPPKDGDERAALEAREKRMANAWQSGVNGGKCPPGNTFTETQKCPPGASGAMRHADQFWKDHNLDDAGNLVRIDRSRQQGLVSEWQDIRRRLYGDEEAHNHDIANVGTLRRDDGVANAGIQMPTVTFAPAQNVTMERYMEMFPDHQPNAHEQGLLDRERAEKDELRQKIDELQKMLDQLKETPKAKTCGDAGGRKKDGDPCDMNTRLDEDGRCRWHPSNKEQDQ